MENDMKLGAGVVMSSTKKDECDQNALCTYVKFSINK